MASNFEKTFLVIVKTFEMGSHKFFIFHCNKAAYILVGKDVEMKEQLIHVIR